MAPEMNHESGHVGATPKRKGGFQRMRNDYSPTAAIETLEVGMHHSLTSVVSLNDCLEAGNEIQKAVLNLRSTVSSYIKRIKDDDIDGKEFTTVSGKFISDDGSKLVCVVTVIRTA